MNTRSNRPEVRNPLLALSSFKRLMALPPLAAYWKAVGVYARHTARPLRRGFIRRKLRLVA